MEIKVAVCNDGCLNNKGITMDIKEGCTLGELVFRVTSEDLLAIVNGTLRKSDYVLQEMDEIMIIPQLFGG